MATALSSTIGRAVGDRLPDGTTSFPGPFPDPPPNQGKGPGNEVADGIMTWKKIMRPAGENCTPDNQVGYFNRV